MDQFKITERHYQIIIKQVLDNLPQESGGFLGGKDGFIQAILPAYNLHLENRTDTFAISQEDITRAREFFDKHGLSYYGVYHSHPNGEPFPSQPDIDTGEDYHFIVGLKNPSAPVFNAFKIVNRVPYQLPFTVVPNDLVKVKELQKSKEKSMVSGIEKEAFMLGEMIDRIRDEKMGGYPKLDPKGLNSDFSTLA